MKSEWRVTSQIINGETLYAVYRLYDKDGIDHSGNREFATGYTPDERKARAVAKKLKRREKVNRLIFYSETITTPLRALD